MSNPLIEDSTGHRLPRFGAIEPAHVAPALDALIGDYQEGVRRLLEKSPSPGWELAESETIWAEALSDAWSPVSHLNSTADNPELREAYNQGLESLTRHSNWRQQHEGIYRAYREVRDGADFAELSPEQQRIVELELRDFELSGIGLGEEGRKRYRELTLRLSKLGAKFAENLLDATRAWTVHLKDPARLTGLPDAELEMLQGLAAGRDLEGWLIDLNFPAFNAIMTHAADRELRREVYTAYVTRASEVGPQAGQWDNGPVMSEILALRHELAQLLGFPDYAAYALARRMADSPATVMDFLQGLAQQAAAGAGEQLAELSRFAADQGAAMPLEAWDLSYWGERYRQSELRLSDEQLKPYFPLESMLDALEYTASKLFGLSLLADTEVETWHPDVRFFWLEDDSGERIAGMFADCFARQDKRGGAWMDVCRSRRRLDESRQFARCLPDL